LKNELQNIISGKSKVVFGDVIQTIASNLERSCGASELDKKDEYFKRQETKILIELINNQKFWVSNINFNDFVSEGAEQRVFLKDSKTVLKLNDSIYYASWLDYFHNLLLNNYFFPDTAYQLLGFYKETEILYAVVSQAFVKATEQTDLQNVKTFLETNGFINNKNNDYHHPKLGIILEDLHDENVLTENGMLRFIDTVFYFDSKFSK
jgi:hypothetical protein